ncbi:T9SS type A sorting domain-containing protein [Hymenobacter sediminicola]|uniref:T9SS type A sorting domain-containing protein n=1 Tax=Hymenobacter sediminicola TaxID=2761579 RepID=A0A7G7WB67_9BACT|nr:T9SS type A sorting domain-containing protein [Hymenobacter sediminicola]QNH63610.1 T9SS type A sorting domain-containing protein [Hymenobacter sediminicola]
MTNTYLRTMRRAFRPQSQMGESQARPTSRLWAMLLLLLTVSFNSFAQTFSEDMTDSGVTPTSREGVVSYTSRGGFTFDATGSETGTLTYSGSARLATSASSSGYTGASGGASIFFGGPATGALVLPLDFRISNINTAALSRVQLTFGLYTQQGVAPATGDFLVQYSTDNFATSTTVEYSRNTNNTAGGTSFAWNLYSVDAALPNVNSLAVRFVRTTQATGTTTTPGNTTKDFRLDDVRVNSLTPTLTATIDSQIFPDTPTNQRSAPQELTVTGSNLTTVATVTAPAGFLVRVAGTTNAYTQSIQLTPNVNGNVSELVDVIFAPTLATSPGPYPDPTGGTLTVSSTGANTRNIAITGNALAPQPILTANPNTLAFGAQTVGTSSALQSFQLTGQDLTGNVTVTAPNGFEIRVGAAPFSPNPITLTTSGGSLNQQVDVRFVPGTTGTITGNVVATGNAGSQAVVAVSGSGTAAPVTPTINSSTTGLDFQTVTNSGSAQTQTFTVSATNLSGPLTLTPSNANIEIRNITGVAGSFSSGPLVINPNPSGNITNQIIEVRLVSAVAIGSFTGNIALTSPSATTVNVAVTANNPSGAISDISLTNPILTEFSTSPGVPSTVKSYNVSADNLLQDLTITAPQFFQIALSADPNAAGGFNSLGSTTGNSLVLPRITGSSDPTLNGDVDLTTIYVRYFPPGPQTNRGQVVSNSSAPARTQFVTVNGSSEPELDVIGSFTPVVNLVKFEKSATQTLLLRGARLASPVVVRVPRDPEPGTTASPLNPARTPQFQISKFADFRDIKPDDEFPGTSLIFTPDENDSLAQVPLYVRYAPSRVGQATADLLFRTPDLFSNVEFTRVPNARLRGNSIDVEPTRQSSATVTRSADGRSVTIVFMQEDGSPFPGNPEGAGFGENRLIIASTSNTLTPGFFPQDATPYDPGNNVYGNGSRINGNFVVFASSATTAIITGLTPGVNYFFFGFEYNNDQVLGAENFKTPNLPITVQLPLPVELVSFTAQLRNGKVNLEWVTASEKNNRGFEVQRSQNGQQFSTVSYKEGRGTTTARTTYTDVDNQPLPGLSYYRLKQIDTDGKFVYSPAVIVKNAGLTEASFYPNPTSGKLTILLPQAANAAALRVQILDLTGRLVREETLPVTGELDLSALQAGTYMVTVGSGDQKVTRKVVKN